MNVSNISSDRIGLKFKNCRKLQLSFLQQNSFEDIVGKDRIICYDYYWHELFTKQNNFRLVQIQSI